MGQRCKIYTEKQISLNIFTNFVPYIPSTQAMDGFYGTFNKKF